MIYKQVSDLESDVEVSRSDRVSVLCDCFKAFLLLLEFLLLVSVLIDSRQINLHGVELVRDLLNLMFGQTRI